MMYRLRENSSDGSSFFTAWQMFFCKASAIKISGAAGHEYLFFIFYFFPHGHKENDHLQTFSTLNWVEQKNQHGTYKPT